MHIKLITGLITGLLILPSFAEEAVDIKEKEQSPDKIELKYEELKLGKVNYLKVIDDNGKYAGKTGINEIANESIHEIFKSYADIMVKTGAMSNSDKEDLAKIERNVKIIEMRNKLYGENKKAKFFDATKPEFKSECFYKTYSEFKTCFEYGFGKVFNIKNIEKRDSIKIAEREAEHIEDELKNRGFKKESGFYVKDDFKYKVEVVGSNIETYMTKKSLEEFKEKALKTIKENVSKKTIEDHLKYIE